MRRWAEFILAHRRLVMVFWLVVAVAGGAVAGPVSERMTTEYSLPGEPGSQTAERIVETFGNGGYTAPYLVTVSFPEGRTVAGDAAGVAAAFANVQAKVPGVRVLDQANTGDPAFVTKDGRTAYAMVFFQYDTSATAKIPTDEIHRALDAAKPRGTTTGVTGESVLAAGSESDGPGVLIEVLIGSIGALAVLAFVFASMLAFLPLIVAAASILATFLLLLPLSELGTFSALVQFLIALIGLGVAIDYSLLVVTRWREERHRGVDNHEAVVIATRTAGHAVVFSGVTVAIGLLALLVLPVPFMRSVGVGGALIPLASVAATLTLTPAILGSVGPRWDWPRIRREDSASRSWSRWAGLMVRRRRLAVGVSAVVLLALVGAFTGIRIGMSSSESLAGNGPAHEALATLERGGVSTGNLTPIEVLATTGEAEAVAAELGRVPGIERAVVSGDAASNRDGTMVVVLIPDEETVNSKTVGPVEDVIDRAEHTPGVLGVTGTGTAQIDFLNAVYGNFPLMLVLIAALTYILLVRAFRSLLLPLKAVLFNLLSMGATFGMVVVFWQQGFGSESVFGVSETGAVTFWVPLTVFAFLFGLSMDYEVFILARMREEYDASGSTTTAIVRGIGRTGRLVTSAALILFLAFAALASSPGTDLKVMATALGFGILLDATVVRSVLLPSLVSLMGDWNWYLPDRIAKILRVEPSRPGAVPSGDDLTAERIRTG